MEEPDAMASAVLVCVLSAVKRARSVGGSMVGLCVQSVVDLFVLRWGSAVRDICRRCCPLCSAGWPSSPALNVTRRAAEGSVCLSCWAFANLLVPCGGCSVRGEYCPVAPSGARWSSWSVRWWANGRSGLRCGSHWGAILMGRLCTLCNGWCVSRASGAPGLSGTVGAGGPWLCLVLVGLREVGSGSFRRYAKSGPLRCGGPLCGATANATGLGHLGCRPLCGP